MRQLTIRQCEARVPGTILFDLRYMSQGLTPMSPRSEYRNQAVACLAAAQRVRNPSDHRAMLEIARLYLKLAERVGVRDALGAARQDEDRSGAQVDG
jgi:hypothetical protein